MARHNHQVGRAVGGGHDDATRGLAQSHVDADVHARVLVHQLLGTAQQVVTRFT
jgi:hypothetical protein